MRILYIGDVMAEPGIAVVEKVLPELRLSLNIDVVIAQAENLSDGKGIRPEDFKRLRKAGVDAGTGGNHSLYREEIFSQLNDPAQPIVRPANYPAGTPGLGHAYITTPLGKILVISLLGQIVGKDAHMVLDNPLHVIDTLLEQEQSTPRIATVVNFHGDYSSEKLMIGHYLDGRVTAVVGDHWHIPTADAEVLPQGTAHITDVGMCGSLDSSLGVRFESLIPRWRDGKVTVNELEREGRMQFNALLVDVDTATGLSTATTHIRRIL